jgi:hypothetical protein
MSTKVTILDAIKRALKARILEQDRYRMMAENLKSANFAPIDVWERWEATCLYMKSFKYPPTLEEYASFGFDGENTLISKQLQLIADEDVRNATIFYIGVAEHTERIKATVKFCEFVGSVGDDVQFMLSIWINLEVFLSIEKEAHGASKDNGKLAY